MTRKDFLEVIAEVRHHQSELEEGTLDQEILDEIEEEKRKIRDTE